MDTHLAHNETACYISAMSKRSSKKRKRAKANRLNRRARAIEHGVVDVEGFGPVQSIEVGFEDRPPRPKTGGAPAPPAPDQSVSADPPPAAPASPGADELLLTIPETCRLLRCSRAKLYRIAPPGRVKLGGTVLYARAVLERWIEDLAQRHDV